MMYKFFGKGAEYWEEFDQKFRLGLIFQFLIYGLKELRSSDCVQALNIPLREYLGMDIYLLLTSRPNVKTSDGLPTPLPTWPSGLRHLTLPILKFRRSVPLSSKAQSMSPRTTFCSRNWCSESKSQLIKMLSGLTSGNCWVHPSRESILAYLNGSIASRAYYLGHKGDLFHNCFLGGYRKRGIFLRQWA